MKKILALIIALTITTAVFSGCSGGNNIIIDTNKTQLYVQVYNGGYGSLWLERLAEKFNTENEGVQVIVLKNKDLYQKVNSEIVAGTAKADLFFADIVKFREAIAMGLMAEITDIVNEVYEGEPEETNTIRKKINDGFMEYMSNNYNTPEEKVYALPTFNSITGLVVNYDMLRENDLLIAEGLGVDGIADTYDDGLPATVAEFDSFMKKITRKGLTPIIWTGLHPLYNTFLWNAIWAQYNGLEDFNTAKEFNGTLSDGTVLTPETGYKVFEMNGRLKALDFYENHILNDENNYSSLSMLGSISHTKAQSNFILSDKTSSPIPMIVDGNWWENEAKGNFSSEEYGKGDFRFMPLPVFEGQKGANGDGTGSVFFHHQGNCGIFINAKSRQIALAKKFLKYIHSEDALKQTTLTTGSMRPYKYILTESELQSLSKFSRNCYEILNDIEHVKFITALSNSPFYQFTIKVDPWKSIIDSKILGNPIDAMVNKGYSAQQYYQGGIDYYKGEWPSIYKEVQHFFN